MKLKPSKWNGFILKKDMVYGEVNNQKFVFYIDYVGEDYQGMGAIVKASVYYLNNEDNKWHCHAGVPLYDIEDSIKCIVDDTHFEFDDTIKYFMSEQEDELYISYEIGNAIDEIIEYKTDDIDYRSLVDSNETLNEYFEPAQLTQIIYGLMEKLNVYEYANPKISAEEMKNKRKHIKKNNKPYISILYIEPNQYPKKIKIKNSFEEMHKLVEGDIEILYPYEKEIAFICNNESKKLNGQTLNRALFDEKGNVTDIIAGKFIICYAPINSDEFLSLPKDVEDKYFDKFKLPENFIGTKSGITVLPFIPEEKTKQQIKKKWIHYS